MRHPEAAKQCHVAGTVRSEAEVDATKHHLRVQRRYQHGLDEVFRGFCRQIVVEVQHHRGVDARGRQQLVLLGIAGERLGTGLRGEQVQRIPVEGDDDVA